MTYFRFGEWRPDADDQDGEHLTVARNVVPAEGSYRRLSQFVRASTVPLSGTALAAKALYQPGDDTVVFAGTGSTLFRAVDREFVPATIGYSSTAWDFAQFGSNALAVSPEEGLLSASIASGSFSTVANAPGARFVARFGDFVVLGGITGSPQRIQWGGFNSLTFPSGGTDVATQADFQDLPTEYGAVMGLAPGQFPTVFQERAISRLTYVGPPTIFNIDTFPIQKGNIARGATAQVFGLTFFIGQDGPNVWDGQSARPIANGRFRRYWRDTATQEDAATAQAAIDFRHNAVIWQWSGGGIVYSWEQDRGAEFSPGVSYPVLLSAPISEAEGDPSTHPSWGEGLTEAGALDSSGYFGMFSSSTAFEATFETADIAVARNRRALVTEVWPDVDAANAYVTLGARDQKASDPLVYGAEDQVNANGMAEFLSDARFHRVRLRMPAGEAWTHAKGLEVTAQPTGAF